MFNLMECEKRLGHRGESLTLEWAAPKTNVFLVSVVFRGVSDSALRTSSRSPRRRRPPNRRKPAGSGMDLYRKIRTAALDAQNVYKVRDASIDREDVHISLKRWHHCLSRTCEWTHHRSNVFADKGEILLIPPNQVERHSLALFYEGSSAQRSLHRFPTSDSMMTRSLILSDLRLRPDIDAADAAQFLQGLWLGG